MRFATAEAYYAARDRGFLNRQATAASFSTNRRSDDSCRSLRRPPVVEDWMVTWRTGSARMMRCASRRGSPVRSGTLIPRTPSGSDRMKK